jgi:hypothetical protein
MCVPCDWRGCLPCTSRLWCAYLMSPVVLRRYLFCVGASVVLQGRILHILDDLLHIGSRIHGVVPQPSNYTISKGQVQG